VEPPLAGPIDEERFAEITLCFTGDNLLGARMPRLVEKHGEEWPYGAVAGVLRAADITFGNLECPITEHGVKTPGKSWESIKERRNFIFKAPPEWSTRLLTNAGFDIVSLANNHAMDYCAQGLLDTCAELDAAGIAYVGGGSDSCRAWQAQVLRRGSTKVGFLACSMVVPAASRAGEDTPGIATHAKAMSEELAQALAELNERSDIVVVTFHWGYEGYRRHAAYQQEIARGCIDAGADVVVGHHPHCLQGVELYNGGVIAYSLGNFLFTGKSALIESAVLHVTASASGVRKVELLPVWVRGGRPEPAPEDAKLLKLVRGICEPCGTELTAQSEWLTVEQATVPGQDAEQE
jgi:poly-gamma-glutamate synthesis protein (capsule biosynthesis protein)